MSVAVGTITLVEVTVLLVVVVVGAITLVEVTVLLVVVVEGSMTSVSLGSLGIRYTGNPLVSNAFPTELSGKVPSMPSTDVK